MASPIFSFLTAHGPDHPFGWISTNPTYRAWLNYPDPQLLYIYGEHGTREASECIFYRLDDARQSSWKNEVTVYFTFDKNDIRYDSAKDMLATFLAQIINHNPTLAEFVLIQFQHLRRDRAYNETDLLSWFEYFRVRGQIDGVTCVINHFDLCDQYSRAGFLRVFSAISQMHERPWKVVVTSRKPRSLETELKGWPVINLDESKPVSDGTYELKKVETESFSSHSARLLPRLSLDKDLEEDQVEQIDRAKVEVRQVILEQERLRDDWKIDSTFQAEFGSVADLTLRTVLERVLETAPDPDSAQDILVWSLYTVRPLTIWEMAMALFMNSSRAVGIEAFATAEFTEMIVDTISTLFAGILAIENNEVQIPDSQVREALGELISVKFDSPHKHLALTCLRYLQRDSVKEMMESVYGGPYTPSEDDSVSMNAPSFANQTNFASYCVQHWCKHFGWIPRHLRSSDLLRDFVESGSVTSFARTHWVLAQPIERSQRSQRLFPLFTALGLSEDAEPWCETDTDISNALYEAALNGHADAVRRLLPRIDHPIKILQETLVTAGANGNEETLLYIIDFIKKKHENFPWPASLLHRMAWLGSVKAVTALLDVGMLPEPDRETSVTSPLHAAIRNGHREVIRLLLRRGADPSLRGPMGQTPTHMASASGHAEITSMLAEAGADLNARDDSNFTPLYEASLWGNYKSVEILASLGADTSLGTSVDENVKGWTPLIVASDEGHIRCVTNLLAGKADPNLPGPNGPPLCYAIRNAHENICEELLRHGADPNDATMDPPALIQIIYGIPDAELRLRLVKLFIKNGANINVSTNDTSLFACAAGEGFVDCVKYLLDCGVDVSGANGNRALYLALENAHAEVVRLLLDNGIKQLSNEKTEQTPLSLALHHADNEEIVRLLLEHGEDPDCRFANGRTPLMAAAYMGCAATVKTLLSYEAAVDLEMSRDKGTEMSGWTALIFALNNGSDEVVRLLGEAHADVNHVFYNGSTPVHRALTSHTLETLMEFRPLVDVADDNGNTPLHLIGSITSLHYVQLLVHAGAPLDIQNNDGYTPLGVALFEGAADIAAYLIEQRANVNIASQTYGAPLHLACQYSQIENVKQLVRAGADIDLAVSGNPGTPLQAALLRRHSMNEILPIVHYLIEEAGADVNRAGGTYGTALAVAALRGSSETVSYLLDHGASHGLVDGMGRLPLHLATMNGLVHLKLIHGAGADIHARDYTGRSVLHWAAQGGHIDVLNHVIKLLKKDNSFNVDDKDNDSWTALCWVARGCGRKSRPIWSTAQVEIIKCLLDNGADINAKAQFSNNEWWTALDIAQYSGAAEDVIEVLSRAVSTKKRALGAEPEIKELKRVNTFRRTEIKAYLHPDSRCMCCIAVSCNIPLDVISCM